VSDEAYLPARSLIRIAAQTAQILGNAGGGALLAVLSPRGALLVDALTFAFSAAMVRLRVADRPNVAEEAAGPVLRDSLRGARSVLAHPEVRRLLVIGWLGPMFSVAPEALAAPYVANHHGSSSLVGWWLVALPAGLVAGDVLAVRLISQQRQQRLVAAGAAASFVPYLCFALDPSLAVALPLLALSGLAGAYSLGLELRLRDATPLPLYARTMTLSSAGLMTLQGLGFAAAGAVAEAAGPATTILAAGACGLAAAAWFGRADRSPGGGNRTVLDGHHEAKW
jgi:predicted MFS family arabinose efflux permease